jgi:SAM-dependent methyltransferase
VKLYVLDPELFRQDNLTNWRRNTEFWIHASLPHIAEVTPAATRIIYREASRAAERFTIVDMGCGNGWVLSLLEELKIAGRYVGLDFNDSLSRYWPSSKQQFVRFVDVESPVPADLERTADVVINAFNFFELPRLEVAFANAVKMLNNQGCLLVFHIDVLSQLISLSASHDELVSGLEMFQRYGSRLAYDKHIDTVQGESQKLYKGILYKMADYHALARHHGLILEDYETMLHVQRNRPQMYEMALWRKPIQ